MQRWAREVNGRGEGRGRKREKKMEEKNSGSPGQMETAASQSLLNQPGPLAPRPLWGWSASASRRASLGSTFWGEMKKLCVPSHLLCKDSSSQGNLFLATCRVGC